MKKKLKYLKRQHKRLPKGVQIAVAIDASIVVSEIVLFAFTLNILHLCIAIWACLVVDLYYSYEKQVRINAVKHYRIGKSLGSYLGKKEIIRKLGTYGGVDRMCLN